MENILKSDIFFFVTTVAVVAVTVVLVVAIIYIIRILSDVKKVSHIAREGAEDVSNDLKSFRGGLKKVVHKVSKQIAKVLPTNKK